MFSVVDFTLKSVSAAICGVIVISTPLFVLEFVADGSFVQDISRSANANNMNFDAKADLWVFILIE